MGKIYDYDFSLGPIKTLTKAVLDDGMVRSNAPMRFVAPNASSLCGSYKISYLGVVKQISFGRFGQI